MLHPPFASQPCVEVVADLLEHFRPTAVLISGTPISGDASSVLKIGGTARQYAAHLQQQLLPKIRVRHCVILQLD